MKYLFILVFVFITFKITAQDSIRVMHYNLMYYGQTTSYCTTSNNSESAKSGYLKTIVQYVKPDILTVNEIAPSSLKHQLLLDNCLNVDGITYYKKGNLSNLSNSDLSNELYYNSQKLALLSQHNIPTSVRDINIYKLYYKASNLSVTHDTAFVNCIVMHLKAGSYAENATERATQTTTLMNYLNYLGIKDNYLLMGDFNVYSGSEACFQNLINPTNQNIKFYDPVNKVGDWNSSSTYSHYHTQSTHTTSTGCFATGGLDDRFDFILISDNIKNGLDNYQYISNTYNTIGQDGNHLNKAVNYNTNNSAPDNVIEALWGMSDHLPVTLYMRVNQTVGINDYYKTSFTNVYFQNPVNVNMDVTIEIPVKTELHFNVINLLGQTIYSKKIESSGTTAQCNIPVSSLNKGIYFLKISDSNNNSIVKKFVKE